MWSIDFSLEGILHQLDEPEESFSASRGQSIHWFDSKSCSTEHSKNNGNGCPQNIFVFGIFGNFSKIRRPGHKAFFICVELNPRCVFFRNLDRDTVFQLWARPGESTNWNVLLTLGRLLIHYRYCNRGIKCCNNGIWNKKVGINMRKARTP